MPYKLLAAALLLFVCITRTSAQGTDSVLNEQYANGSWQNTYLNINNYDAQCHISNNVAKLWDETSQVWINNSLSTNTYDNMGRISEMVSQNWDAGVGQWINNALQKYDYLDAGNSFTLTISTWDNVSSSWQNNTRLTFLFNNAGYETFYLNEMYINGMWQPSLRFTYNYDAKNNITRVNGESWQNNAWVKSFKAAYAYIANDRLAGVVFSNWSADDKNWVKTNRQAMDYLPVGMQVQNSIAQFYDINKKSWVNSARTENKYYSNDAIKLSDFAYWDVNSGNWINTEQLKYDYYNDGSFRKFYLNLWNATNHVWYGIYRSTYTHHSCNLQVNITSAGTSNQPQLGADKRAMNTNLYKGNMDALKNSANTWQYDVHINRGNGLQGGVANYHIITTASPAANAVITNNVPAAAKAIGTLSKTAFTLSPNPAHAYFIVTPGTQAHAAAAATLNMYDLQGKLMISKKWQAAGTQKIALPAIAKGMYIVTITSAGNVQSMKLVVE